MAAPVFNSRVVIIPHEPNQLAAQRLEPLNTNIPEDNFTATVVGEDNSTGQSLVAEPCSKVSLKTNPVTHGKSGTLSRDRSSSRQGSRKTTMDVSGSPALVAAVRASQAAFESEPDPNCLPTASPNNSYSDPNPPEDEPAPEPEDPQNPDNGPEDSPEDQSEADGCDPDSPGINWYLEGCPAGTTQASQSVRINYRGTWFLCTGENPPPGDGCPDEDESVLAYACIGGRCTQDPSGTFATYDECIASGCFQNGYSCIGGFCTLVPIGEAQFPTLEACEANPCPDPIGYNCVSGTCIEEVNGLYPTLEACRASGCVPIRYNCFDGECQESPSGTYLSLEECQANCARDNEPGALYNVTVSWQEKSRVTNEYGPVRTSTLFGLTGRISAVYPGVPPGAAAGSLGAIITSNIDNGTPVVQGVTLYTWSGFVPDPDVIKWLGSTQVRA